MELKISIRQEVFSDFGGTKNVNDLAFGRQSEGLLVEKLRMNPAFVPQLSLVAEVLGEIAGHILFFPVRIRNGWQNHESLALAPMSVLPELQRKGIGKELITKGLEVSRALGFKSVIVLGHSEYYPKFGFKPASNWKIGTYYKVDDEVFMATELVHKGLKDVSGMVEYPEEFEEVD